MFFAIIIDSFVKVPCIIGQILKDLGRKSEAADVYRGLISRNPENRNYYIQLENSLDLQTEAEKLDLYQELKEK